MTDRTTAIREQIENVLKQYGVHWNGPVEPTGAFVDDLIAAAVPELAKVTVERDALFARRAELLATIVRLTNETPFQDEVAGWVTQRAAMIAEVGTLRAERDDLARALKKAPLRTFDHAAGDRLADEVAVLIDRRVLDTRSPAADALLDYRSPPRSDRSDRMVELERSSEHAALLERERDAYRSMLCDLLGSASPNEKEHPSMSRQWRRARELAEERAVVVKLHVLKTWPVPFQALWEGVKHHEVRRRDRDFQVGDLLELREWDWRTELFTDRRLVMRVTYITPGGTFGIPAELCVMSVVPEAI